MVPKHRRSDLEQSPVSAARGYEQSWQDPQDPQDWQDWQDWGPSPELHPDHPSAPVPRVRFADDHPSKPMPAYHAPGVTDPRSHRPRGSSRGWIAPPPAPDPSYYNGHRRLHAVPGFESAPAEAARRPPATDYTAQISQQAQDYAAAIREAAEREATAITQQATTQAAGIREAAERDAAEFLARLDLMSGELRRVAAYITECLVAPSLPPMPATSPAFPDAEPGRPATRPVPESERQRPASSPPEPKASSAVPGQPKATAQDKRQKPGRQRQAMRIATASTAALLSFAVITGAAELGLHGYKFFVFRAGGVGQTPGNETDQQFLNREAAAAHHVAAPKGRHAKKSHGLVEVHKNG